MRSHVPLGLATPGKNGAVSRIDLPLARLKRHSNLMLLARNSPRTNRVAGAQEIRLRFLDLQSASDYLRFWLRDTAAMSLLRQALLLSSHWLAVSRCCDHQVIRAVASQLVSGTLILVERRIPPAMVDVPCGHSSESQRTDAHRSSTDMGQKSSARSSSPKRGSLPVLPALEDVQIEGAYVLPEILQTLEQIDVSISNVQLASVSLEPAPSGVPPIKDSMQKSKAAVTSTLDSL